MAAQEHLFCLSLVIYKGHYDSSICYFSFNYLFSELNHKEDKPNISTHFYIMITIIIKYHLCVPILFLCIT